MRRIIAFSLIAFGCQAQIVINNAQVRAAVPGGPIGHIDFWNNAHTQVTVVRASSSGTVGIEFSGVITSTAGDIISTSTGSAQLSAVGALFGSASVHLDGTGRVWDIVSSGTSNLLSFKFGGGSSLVDVTSIGLVTSNGGGFAINSSSSDAIFSATTGAPFATSKLSLVNANSWDVKSDASGNFVIRNVTTGTDIFSVNKTTNAVTCAGCGGAGAVSSFNTRTGAVTLTSADVTSACTTCLTTSTGVSSFNSRTGTVTLTSGDVTSALGYTPPSSAVTSFNSRTGTVNLTSGDVTGALGYAPGTGAHSPGLQIFSTFSGTTGTLGAYTNGIYVYDSGGSFVGMIPII